ncbi:MAG: RsmE family RNA methyltransferase, partial [Alphaproteobacteria bacterium]|nr:RsmE family RNA methyltransferase [Alphaproteobacteria bacterium]
RRVMRLGDGDSVALFNGRDGEWRAEVAGDGRRGLPEIAAPVRFDAFLDSCGHLFWADEQGGSDAFDTFDAAGPGPATLLIGPEGGFADEERAALGPAATAVSLGPRILRADTAAVSLLTLWQAAAGDWEAD